MSTITRRRTIDAPPAEVWATLADFGNIAVWAPDVDHSCLTTSDDDPLQTTRRVQAGSNTLLEDVIVWQPPERLAYRLRGLPPMAGDVTTEWRLADAATAGRTDVSVTTTVAGGPRPPQRIIARVLAVRLGRAADRLLAGLAEHLRQETARRGDEHLHAQPDPGDTR